jgi:nucleotide-binding universal stress UspA family protein
MYETILIPYDGSDEARMGAEHGLGLAAALGASVHVLYVINIPGTPRAVALRDDEEEVRERYREYADEILGELSETAEEKGVEAVTTTRTGSVSQEIVEYADEEAVDAIVMGSAYRGKIGNLIGGTTDKVVRSASVPVITKRMSTGEVR